MEEKNIGYFIQELRKNKGLTQKQLANAIGISDKTISKWENGYGVPDTAILVPLCEILEISVNELLSGAKLPPEDYSKKAEENIMDLLKDKEKNIKNTKVLMIIGIIMGILSIFLLFAFTPNGFKDVVFLLDFPTLMIIAMICTTCVLVSGARTKIDILNIIRKVIIPTGAFVFWFSVIIILTSLTSLEQLGPSIAVAILSVVYSILIYIIIIPIINQLEKRKNK